LPTNRFSSLAQVYVIRATAIFDFSPRVDQTSATGISADIHPFVQHNYLSLRVTPFPVSFMRLHIDLTILF
jgi:hypothetical protein